MSSNASYYDLYEDYGRRDYHNVIYNSYPGIGNNYNISPTGRYSENDIYTKKQRSTHTHTRSAANLRERRRMKCINEAFEGLRKHIPTLPYEKRLSKVDTLRLAICYINFLNELVTTDTSIQPERSFIQPKEENQGKVIILNTSKDQFDGTTRVRGHSLSWSFDRQDNQGVTRVKTKKVWWPEQGVAPTDCRRR